MTALRCTAKLRRRLGVTDLPEVAAPSNALGDWYAHLLTVDRRPLVLAVSKRGRLAIVLPARDMKNFAANFLVALSARLVRLGVDVETAAREMAATAPVELAATRSRSVLGSINDFGFQLQARAAHPLGRGWTVESFEDELAEIPCMPLGGRHPAEVARELLGAAGARIPLRWRRRAGPETVN